MKVDELDLSYSGLVEIVQSDLNKGTELIEILAKAAIASNEVIEQAEKQLKYLKDNRNSYRGGIEKIAKHFKLQPPLNFVFDNTIYAVNESWEVSTFEIANVPKANL